MASLKRQIYFLIHRNVRMKLRNKQHIQLEISTIIVSFIVIAVIKHTLPTEYDAIPTFPRYTLEEHERFLPNGSMPLGFAPNTTEAAAIMEVAAEKLKITADPATISFKTEDDFLSMYLKDDNPSFDTGIIFSDDFSSNHGNLSYKIRLPYGNIPSGVRHLTSGLESCRSEMPSLGLADDNCGANMYLWSGFLSIQVAVDHALASVLSNKTDLPVPDLSFQMFPKEAYTSNLRTTKIILSEMFVAMVTPFIGILLTYLVGEKEKKTKQCMKIMGMKESAFWVAWAVTSLAFITVTSLLIVAISFAIGVFRKSKFILIFSYFFFYGTSSIALCFTISPLFSKGKTAGIMGSVIILVKSLLSLTVSLREGVPLSTMWGVCFLSPVAMALSIDKAVEFEFEEGGLTFDNFTSGEFPPYATLVMLIVDTFLYLILAIYFQNMCPGPSGRCKPPWYCFLSSYWSSSESSLRHVVSDSYDVAVSSSTDDVEAVSDDVRQRNGIKIYGFEKMFPGNKYKKIPEVKAVNGISLDVYEGQITCLLGHKGAGKSTLINLLTNTMHADDGSVTIYGCNIQNPLETDMIRGGMTGVCFQENSVLENLSPVEHLKVLAGLKGVPYHEIDDVVQHTLKEVSLEAQAETYASGLTTGQQRQLCVGMAIIGKPKVLFLDEPTHGMDSSTRSKMWSLLKRLREDRVMVVTTQSVDETDIIADRQAIIHKGSLRNCGSSSFLKDKLGSGYHLKRVLYTGHKNMVVNVNCAIDDIGLLVEKHVPEAKLDRTHEGRLSYMLPIRSASHFADLFEALEHKEDPNTSTTAMTLGIQSYTVSMTTFEEAFLKLNEEVEEKEGKENGSKMLESNKTDENNLDRQSPSVQYGAMDNTEPSQLTPTADLPGETLDCNKLTTKPITTSAWAQIKAVWRTQFLFYTRTHVLYINKLILPLIYISIGVLLLHVVHQSFTSDQADPIPVTLDPSLYLSSTVDEIPDKTSILYKDSLPADQNISRLVAEFSSQDINSEPISDLSVLASMAPHSIAIDAMNIATKPNYTALYNDTTTHSLPLATSIMNNALYHLTNGLTPDQQIITTSQPFPRHHGKLYFHIGLLFLSFFALSIAFVPPDFALSIIRDRQMKTKSQLHTSGVDTWTYWVAHFIFDIPLFAIPFVIGLIYIGAFQIETFLQPGALLVFVVFLLVHIPMITVFSYCVSFRFRDFQTAGHLVPQIFTQGGNLLAMTVVVNDLLVSHTLAKYLHIFFCILSPPYTVYGTMYYIDRVYQVALLDGTVDQLTVSDYFKMQNLIVPEILLMLLPLVGWFFTLRFLEVRHTGDDPTCLKSYLKSLVKKKLVRISKVRTSAYVEDIDADVVEEQEKVQQLFNENKNCAIAINSLHKEFTNQVGVGCCKKIEKTRVAVHNLSLAIDEGEVVGLLGPSGAGKTMVLDAIIDGCQGTKGQIQVAGHDVTSSLSEVHKIIGYCPQIDPLYPEVTVRQHLEIYAAIRGIHQSDVQHVTEQYMKSIQIFNHADTKCKDLSAEVKRKLCVGISMLGDPEIVLLDEPTTGMDFKSKHLMWDVLSSSLKDKRGAIVATDSLQEAEAICSRVAILVSGQLKCLGTTKHLRDKHSGDYILQVKLHIGAQDVCEERLESLHKYVLDILPDARISEQVEGRVTYKIPKKAVISLASVFGSMEKEKEKLRIAEYSFSQITLEQVFIEFAKMQQENDIMEELPTKDTEDSDMSYNRLLEEHDAIA